MLCSYSDAFHSENHLFVLRPVFVHDFIGQYYGGPPPGYGPYRPCPCSNPGGFNGPPGAIYQGLPPPQFHQTGPPPPRGYGPPQRQPSNNGWFHQAANMNDVPPAWWKQTTMPPRPTQTRPPGPTDMPRTTATTETRSTASTSPQPTEHPTPDPTSPTPYPTLRVPTSESTETSEPDGGR